MSKVIEKAVAFICIFLLLVILGCAAFQDLLTPAYISPTVLKYADANGTSILPWTTLYDAKRVSFKLDFVHAKDKLVDELQYKYLAGVSLLGIGAAEELKATLFDPTGPVGLFVTTSLGGIAGALLIPRPKDRKKISKLREKNNQNA